MRAMARKRQPPSEPLADEKLLAQVREDRAEDRKNTLEWIVEAALLYYLETQRSDGAHKARLSARERELREAIEAAYEAMHPGPITKEELELTKEMMELLAKDEE